VFVDDPPLVRASRTLPDSFPHDRHKSLTCITCHLSKQAHGRLTFEAPRGCMICHHQAAATLTCSTCHRDAPAMAAETVQVVVQVKDAPLRTHRVPFDHATHRELRCVQCHTTPVTLAPSGEVARCSTCHEDHHAAGRSCASCHAEAGPELRAAHARPAAAHEGCDACHRSEEVRGLVPDRRLCLTCHVKQQDHYAAQECTVCHFQAGPAQYQSHLRRGGGT